MNKNIENLLIVALVIVAVFWIRYPSPQKLIDLKYIKSLTPVSCKNSHVREMYNKLVNQRLKTKTFELSKEYVFEREGKGCKIGDPKTGKILRVKIYTGYESFFGPIFGGNIWSALEIN